MKAVLTLLLLIFVMEDEVLYACDNDMYTWLEEGTWQPGHNSFDSPNRHVIQTNNDAEHMSSVSKSAKSDKTTASGLLAKERAKLVELETRKAALKQKLELETKLSEFQIQTEIDVSRARQQVLQSEAVNQILPSPQYEFFSSPILPTSQPTNTIRPTFTATSNVNESEVPKYRPEETCRPNVNDVPKTVNQVSSTSPVQDIVQKQIELSELIINQQRRNFLPQPELEKFDGNVKKYTTFIKGFESRIEVYCCNDNDKLYYLDQFTTGSPNQIVQSCMHMEPSRGLERAKQLLKEKFGDKFKITTEYMNELLEWQNMKPDHYSQLSQFSQRLLTCLNAMTDIHFLRELNNYQNLRILMKKLPYGMQDRWNRKAFDLCRNKGREPSFEDFVNFVNTEVDIFSNPVFGKNIDEHKHAKHTFSTGVDNYKQRLCYFCSGKHELDWCKDFAKLNYDRKRMFAREQRLCYGCLHKFHDSRNCHNKKTCRKCGKNHPTAFHLDDLSQNKPFTPNRGPSTNDSYQQRREFPPNGNQTLINESHRPQQNPDSNSRSNVPFISNGCVSADEVSEDDIMMAVVPATVRSKDSNVSQMTYVFMDHGSSGCIMTNNLKSNLKVDGVKTSINLGTMHGQSEVNSTIIKGLDVTDITGTNTIKLPPVFAMDDIPVSTARIPRPEIINRWEYLRDIFIPRFFPDIEIGLLIGTNCHKALEPLKVIPSQNNGPYAVLTKLGWTVNGPTNFKTSTYNIECNRIIIKNIHRDASLESRHHELVLCNDIHAIDTCKQFERILESDFIDNNNSGQAYSQEDRKFLKIVESGTVFRNGHYQVPLPFRNDDVYIPNNREQSLKRLNSLKRKFEQYPQYKDDYVNFINDLLINEYAVKVPENHLNTIDGHVWYIPHHGVYHPRKPDKLRVVYDCSASWRGLSLNSELLQGPIFTNSVIGTLIRLRECQIAFMADVEKMFYQVKVPESDYDYLRFLWWPNGDVNLQPEEYKMTVHIFGAVSSPSVANYALKRTANDNPQFGQLVTNSVKRNFYVDDLLKSCDNEQEAVKLANDLIEICSLGGFNLTKFISNSRTFINSIPENKRAKGLTHLDINYDDLPTEHALGVQWDIEKDIFSFKIHLKEKSLTRRGILSVVGSIYDPLGFLAPVTLNAKRILQDLCAAHLGWDDDIPEDFLQRWIKWKEQLFNLDQLEINRCFIPSNFGNVVKRELHIFSDASSIAYGSVCYQRVFNENGQIYCAFIIGKSRLAPLKQMTIPRLELSAASLSVRLSSMLLKELDLLPESITYWTDSTTVLQYIKNDSKRFHVFVANRVSSIRDSSNPDQWKYVNTLSNPADDASRIISVQNFVKDPRWLMGPGFLWNANDTWPEQPELQKINEDPEIKREVSTLATETEIDPVNKLITHFSSWFRLKRAVAYLLRLRCILLKRAADVKNVKRNVPKELKDENAQRHINREILIIRKRKELFVNLSVDDLSASEIAIVKFIQNRAFPIELKALCSKAQNVSKSSALYRLDPIVIGGLLRVGGRLRNSDLPENVKHPIILPRNGHVTSLVVMDTHKALGHGGRYHTLSSIRENYWIINANSVTRYIIAKCVVCRKLRSPVMNQKMADLPTDRVTVSLPFARVGVDYFGPFLIKEGRKELKRYGVVFVCLSIKAIHIEIASSLDTSSFIQALRRFIARRGQCEEIRSDNGSNFCGGERELRLEINKWNQSQINNELLQRNIKWTFNPPAASHHGGIWERQIRTIRKVLNALLSVKSHPSLNEESFRTLMCEVEAIVNSRPLTFTSDDPSDFDPLTPNQLLTMRSKWLLPPGQFQKEDVFARKSWKQVQYLADSFWQRWRKEYLSTLQERVKWSKPQLNLSINDIVLVVDENVPRNQWCMGRVIETVCDAKGFIRSATVKTQNSVLRRPIANSINKEELEKIASTSPIWSEILSELAGKSLLQQTYLYDRFTLQYEDSIKDFGWLFMEQCRRHNSDKNTPHIEDISWLKTVKIQQCQDLLQIILHQTLDCLLDSQWELKRIAQQVLPLLSEVTRWYDIELNKSIIKDNLTSNNPTMVYMASFLLKESLEHCVRLLPLLKDPPKSWKDELVCCETIDNLLQSLKQESDYYLLTVETILYRTSFDRLSLLAVEIIIILVNYFNIPENKKLSVGESFFNFWQTLFQFAHPTSQICHVLQKKTEPTFSSPYTGYLSCCLVEPESDILCARQVEKCLVSAVYEHLSFYLSDTCQPRYLPIITHYTGLFADDSIVCKELVHCLLKLSVIIVDPVLKRSISTDMKPIHLKCLYYTLKELSAIIAIKTFDTVLLEKILSIYLVLCRPINPNKHLPSLFKAICSRLNKGRNYTGDVSPRYESTSTDSGLNGYDKFLPTLYQGHISCLEIENNDFPDFDANTMYTECLSLNTSFGKRRTLSVSIDTKDKGGGAAEDAEDSDWDSWSEDDEDESTLTSTFTDFLFKMKKSMNLDCKEMMKNEIKKLKTADRETIHKLATF